MEIGLSIPDISNTLQIRCFHFQVVSSGWSYHDHYHTSFEILFCVDGNVTEWVDGQPILFKSGEWLLIPPGMKHKTFNHSETSFTYLSLLFDIDDIKFRREMKSLSNYHISRDEAIETPLPSYIKVIDSIIQSYIISSSNKTDFHIMSIFEKLELQAHILLIIKSIVCKLQKNTHPRKIEKTVNTYELDLAHRIEKMLMANLARDDISVQDISKQIGLNRNQCTLLFTKVFGMSPRHYITTQRLLRAKEMLIQTSQSIESISRELGFSSQSHFSRQFKRWTGISPLKYRPKHQINFKVDTRI